MVHNPIKYIDRADSATVEKDIRVEPCIKATSLIRTVRCSYNISKSFPPTQWCSVTDTTTQAHLQCHLTPPLLPGGGHRLLQRSVCGWEGLFATNALHQLHHLQGEGVELLPRSLAGGRQLLVQGRQEMRQVWGKVGAAQVQRDSCYPTKDVYTL